MYSQTFNAAAGLSGERAANDMGEMEQAMTDEQTDFKPQSLDDVLTTAQPEPAADTSPDPVPEPETPKEPDPVVVPEAEAAKADGDTATEAKGEGESPKEDAPPASDETESPVVPLKALHDERRKRQELETKVGALQQQMNATARPDPFDDPEGAAKFDKQLNQEAAFNMRVEMSQEMMRELHEDYDEVESVFMDAARANPALAAQMSQHPSPARFAYAEGKRVAQLNEMGSDPVAYVEKKMAEAAKAGAAAAIEEMNKEQSTKLKALIPESLAEAPSATLKDVKAWSGPKPMNELLG